MSVEIVHPEYLILLGSIPIIIFLHFFMLRRKRSDALKFANFSAIAKVKGVELLSKNIVVLALSIIMVALLVFSLAGVNVQRSLYSSSISYIVAIDTSSSMEATDFSPNRLEAAKSTAIEFIKNAPVGTKFGVISFSGNAFIEQSITQDKKFLQDAIEKIPLSSIGGTDLSEAVITSTNLLEGQEAKAIIILSDGRINVGTIENALTYANNHDVVINTIGIGTTEGGKTSFGLSKIDEDALKALAHNTNGKYFSAESNDKLLDSLNQILDLKFKEVTFDITPYLILAALIVFILEYILINSRFRVLP